jgi:hypothetical protein
MLRYLAAALVLALLVPASAMAGERQQKPVGLMGLLLPFKGHDERALVHAIFRGRSHSFAIGGENGGGTYAVQLSRRSCAGVRRNPDSPRFIGPPLAEPARFSDTWFDDTRRVTGGTINVYANLRSTKSVVLTTRDGGKFQPRACGTPLMVDIANLPGT